MTDASQETAPKVFISYSYDSDEHRAWVLRLADRLIKNGVDVVLDQYDLRFGSDLPHFMESGLTSSKMVLAVCTENYVEKANSGKGGVGYEKMILTAQLMQNLTTDHIIPLVKDNNLKNKLPTFLGSRRYADFSSPNDYEYRYSEVLHEIHGEKVISRPPLGPNPFRQKLHHPVIQSIASSPDRYSNPAISGNVEFDCANNNGHFAIGSGAMTVVTAWGYAGRDNVYVYDHKPSNRSVAIAKGAKDIAEVTDATLYDISSYVRSAYLGQVVIWQNVEGYYAAVKVEAIRAPTKSEDGQLTFSFKIEPNRNASFENL